MSERKSLSKKIRFEVFKRDSFKCQYCGKEAPEVTLEVDHIKPVAEGGSNDLTNLITSCFDCNRGKGARELDDDEVIKKNKKQLNEINARREQLEMLMEWKDELMELDKEKVNAICDYWYKLTNYTINETGRPKIEDLVRKYEVKEILQAIDDAADTYLKRGDDGQYTHESVEKSFSKLTAIIKKNKNGGLSEEEKKIYYIRGIMKNRFYYINMKEAIKYLFMAYENEVDLDLLEHKAKNEWNNWTEFKNDLFNNLLNNNTENNSDIKFEVDMDTVVRLVEAYGRSLFFKNYLIDWKDKNGLPDKIQTEMFHLDTDGIMIALTNILGIKDYILIQDEEVEFPLSELITWYFEKDDLWSLLKYSPYIKDESECRLGDYPWVDLIKLILKLKERIDDGETY